MKIGRSKKDLQVRLLKVELEKKKLDTGRRKEDLQVCLLKVELEKRGLENGGSKISIPNIFFNEIFFLSLAL